MTYSKKQLKNSGIQIKITEQLKIDKVAFSKKDFDIYCSFYLTEAKMAVFTSIVNLSFIDKGPLFTLYFILDQCS